MAKPTPPKGIDWAAVKRDFEDGATIKALSKTYGVAERTIWRRKRSAKEGEWTRPAPVELEVEPVEAETPIEKRGVLLKLLQGGARGDDHPGPDAAPGAPVTDEMLADGLRALAHKVTTELLHDLIAPGQNQSRADVYKNGAEVIVKAIAASRDVAGKKPGQASTDAEIDRSATTIVRRVIERSTEIA